MKKTPWVVATMVVLTLMIAAPVSAHDGAGCAHDDPTIGALRECVVHAASEGHITSPAVTKVLLAELDAAQAALDRGRPRVAINLLRAFIWTVQAQSGKHIAAEHAAHLIEHAQMVIQALSQ